MIIDGIKMSDVQEIEYNYDNIGVLKIVKYLLGVVINDVDFMNEEYINGTELLYENTYDLGNNYKIKVEDYESIVSILDTIQDILDDNKEV